jgi:hypothetical protein
VIAGCCLFSMFTVYKFGCATFDDEHKAAWYVTSLEGVMLVSHGLASEIALARLLSINVIANGCVITLARDSTLRRQEADARRQAAPTRATTSWALSLSSQICSPDGRICYCCRAAGTPG